MNLVVNLLPLYAKGALVLAIKSPICPDTIWLCYAHLRLSVQTELPLQHHKIHKQCSHTICSLTNFLDFLLTGFGDWSFFDFLVLPFSFWLCCFLFLFSFSPGDNSDPEAFSWSFLPLPRSCRFTVSFTSFSLLFSLISFFVCFSFVVRTPFSSSVFLCLTLIGASSESESITTTVLFFSLIWIFSDIFFFTEITDAFLGADLSPACFDFSGPLVLALLPLSFDGPLPPGLKKRRMS